MSRVVHVRQHGNQRITTRVGRSAPIQAPLKKPKMRPRPKKVQRSRQAPAPDVRPHASASKVEIQPVAPGSAEEDDDDTLSTSDFSV